MPDWHQHPERLQRREHRGRRGDDIRQWHLQVFLSAEPAPARHRGHELQHHSRLRHNLEELRRSQAQDVRQAQGRRCRRLHLRGGQQHRARRRSAHGPRGPRPGQDLGPAT